MSTGGLAIIITIVVLWFIGAALKNRATDKRNERKKWKSGN